MPRPREKLQYATVMFENLGLAPSQNPYNPTGFRKMDDVWFGTKGESWARMIPGYTEIITDQASNIWGLSQAISGEGERHTFVLGDTSGTGKIWELNPASTLDEIYSSASLGTSQSAAAVRGTIPYYGHQDDVYIFTGDTGNSDRGRKIDVSTQTDTDAGLTRYAGSLSAALGTVGGAVQGVVKYWISNVSGTDEGAISDVLATIDAKDGYEIDLSSITDPDTSVRRVYRSFADGDQPFFLTSLDAGVTTYTDDIADVDLGNLPPLHGDTPPDSIVDATWHYGRAYVLTNDGKIYWSDPDAPESWYTQANGNFFVVEGGTKTLALTRVPDGLVALQQDKLFLIRGRTPSQFRLVEVTPADNDAYGYGVDGPGQYATSPYGVFIYHHGSRSVYHYAGGNQARRISDDIRSDLEGPTETNMSTSLGVVAVRWLAREELLAVSLKNITGGSDFATWLYDPIKRKWVGKASYGFSLWSAWRKSGARWSYVATDGQTEGTNFDINRVLTGVNHNGSTITPVLGVPTFTGDNPHIEKTLSFVDLLCHPGGTTETVKVDWFIDGATSSDGNATVTMTGTDSRERHRVSIGERGREFDIDLTLDDATMNSGVYGIVFGFTMDGSVTGS